MTIYTEKNAANSPCISNGRHCHAWTDAAAACFHTHLLFSPLCHLFIDIEFYY